MKRTTLALLASATLTATTALLLGAAPPGVQPAPERLPGCDPCNDCGLALQSGGFTAGLHGASGDDCLVGMYDLQLEITDGNVVATYDLADTHGLTDLEPGESATLEFEDPGFTPSTAKLHYTRDDSTYGTSTLDIE